MEQEHQVTDLDKNRLGLDKNAGDAHYRAFVGPPYDYDLIAAMCFNLLTSIGLRQHHRVLDIGCGSLRVGRLLIPYLNKHGYIGIEPNQWLLDHGVAFEVGKSQIEIKQPTLHQGTSIGDLNPKPRVDYALAQSIFTHCGTDIIEQWMREVSENLNESGAFLINYWQSEKNFEGQGWVYPSCVKYTREKFHSLGSNFGFAAQDLDWFHPRLKWICLYKSEFDHKLLRSGKVHWNNLRPANSNI